MKSVSESLQLELNLHITNLQRLIAGTCKANDPMRLIFEESDKHYGRFRFPGIHALIKIYDRLDFRVLDAGSSAYTIIKKFFIDNNITTFGDFVEISKLEGGAYKRCKWIKHGKIVYKGRERVSYMWKTHTAIKLLVTANDGSRHFRYKKLNIASR